VVLLRSRLDARAVTGTPAPGSSTSSSSDRTQAMCPFLSNSTSTA
jgi:hypothetical protein